MGQYYNPASLDKMQYVYSHSYGNGLKLMEHSYLGNNFVAVVERLIAKGGQWYGDRIIWAGDYADNELDGEANIYQLVSGNEIKPPAPETKGVPEFRFLVNMDTKEFVNMDRDPYAEIHPLPLLTCEGNGRGGGDFHGEDPNELIGKWARNRITVQNEQPDEGYTELIFDLSE